MAPTPFIPYLHTVLGMNSSQLIRKAHLETVQSIRQLSRQRLLNSSYLDRDMFSTLDKPLALFKSRVYPCCFRELVNFPLRLAISSTSPTNLARLLEPSCLFEDRGRPWRLSIRPREPAAPPEQNTLLTGLTRPETPPDCRWKTCIAYLYGKHGVCDCPVP